MKAGGIFPAIVGTIVLVVTSIALLPAHRGHGRDLPAASTPGTTSSPGSSTWPSSTWPGVPSIVFGLFGFSLFVIFLKFGVSILPGP